MYLLRFLLHQTRFLTDKDHWRNYQGYQFCLFQDMNTGSHEKDLLLAQETCSELRSGNNDAILNIYNQYHPLLLGYTRRRLRSSDSDSEIGTETSHAHTIPAPQSWRRGHVGRRRGTAGQARRHDPRGADRGGT